MFNLLHSTTNQELLSNQSIHYEKYEWFPLRKPSHATTNFTVNHMNEKKSKTRVSLLRMQCSIPKDTSDMNKSMFWYEKAWYLLVTYRCMSLSSLQWLGKPKKTWPHTFYIQHICTIHAFYKYTQILKDE